MKQYVKLALCVLLSVLLLTGCGKQPSEDASPTTTQPVTEATHGLEEGELPPVVIPQQTKPAEEVTAPETTQPTEGTKPPETTKPTEGTQPPETTEPTESTQPPETTEPTEGTQPPETTEPTESTDPPGFDDDELPPVPVG